MSSGNKKSLPAVIYGQMAESAFFLYLPMFKVVSQPHISESALSCDAVKLL